MKNGIETLTESFELPTIPSCPKDKPCMTKSGMVCNFPFTFNGNTYSQCTDIPNSKFTKKSYFGKLGCEQGDCRKEPRRDPLCNKTKINQNS